MSSDDTEIRTLEAEVARRERTTLWRTLFWTLLPVAAALVILVVTLGQVNEAQEKLATANAELEEVEDRLDVAEIEARELDTRLAELRGERDEARTEADAARQEGDSRQQELERLREELNTLNEKLRQSSNFSRNMVELTWSGAKTAASRSMGAAQILDQVNVWRDEGVGWGWANTPEGGFVSPGFAGFVLQNIGVLPEGRDPIEALQSLPYTPGVPDNGDVVYYESGFSMFYIDVLDEPFVVGMTPIGIVALKPEFGPKRLGIYRTGLQ